MIDSGMMVHEEGFGISRLGVCQVAPSMATIAYGEEKENRCWQCWRRCLRQGQEGCAEAGGRSAQYLFGENEANEERQPCGF